MRGMTEELVHYGVADAVATITLDSPHNRNALSQQLVTELFERLGRAAADPAVKVALIRQEGKVFCSGADLSEATSVGMAGGARRIVELQRLIVSLDKPVVTRVSGAVRPAASASSRPVTSRSPPTTRRTRSPRSS